MMTTGQCMNCWIRDEHAQECFKLDARDAAASVHKFMENAELEEFDVVDIATDSYFDLCGDNEDAFPIDPAVLAADAGEGHADSVYSTRNSFGQCDTQRCDGGCGATIWIKYDAEQCESCQRRYEYHESTRPCLRQQMVDFACIREENDDVRESDWDAFSSQYEMEWSWLCRSCYKCLECVNFEEKLYASQRPRRVRCLVVYAAIKLKIAAIRARKRAWKPNTTGVVALGDSWGYLAYGQVK